MRIKRAEEYIQEQENWFRLEQPADAVFKRLKKPSLGGAFEEPSHFLIAAIECLWIKNFLNPDAPTNFDVLRQVLVRSFEVYEIAEGHWSRGQHDLLLLSASVILGECQLIDRAVALVRYAEPGDKRFFDSACCGILKARLLSEPEREAQQLELRLSSKGLPSPMGVPSRASHRAFVNRRNDLLRSNVAKKCRELHQFVEKQIFFNLHEEQDYVSHLSFDFRPFWPWSELVLLKIAFGKDVPTIDDCWIPKAFCNRG